MASRKDPPVVKAYYNTLLSLNIRAKYGPPERRCFPRPECRNLMDCICGASWSPNRASLGLGHLQENFEEFRRFKLKEMKELRREAKKTKKELKKIIKREKKELKKIKREQKELKRIGKEDGAERKRKAKETGATKVDEDEVPLKKLKLDEVDVDANQERKFNEGGTQVVYYRSGKKKC